MKEELEKVLFMKNGIPTKLLKNLGEDLHNFLCEIITKSYKARDIPEEFIKRRTTTLPKLADNIRRIALGKLAFLNKKNVLTKY